MFLIFKQEKVITICMLVFLGISIFIKVLLGMVYQRMIKETDNMAATENKLLKQCKIKFANCYQLNNGVANVPVFVDKFLNRMALGPFSFVTLYHMSGQTMLLSVVCAGAGICKSIMDGRMLGEILPFYIASFAGLYLYFSVSTVVDIKGRRRILKINLVDYLENHLSARMQITEADIAMLYGENTYALDGYPGMNARKRRRKRIENELRTVELMPIGRNLAAAKEENTIDYSEVMRETSNGTDKTDNSSAVTMEELEALLQEFLTV